MNNREQVRTAPTILCIDDDPAIAASLALRLQPFDVHVSTAYFGQQGIWMAVTERPDLIITDLRMPQGQGGYVVECLRGRPDTRDVPVIVLTGCREIQSQKRMHGLGVRHYLHKPVMLAELLRAIETYVPLTKRELQAAAAPSRPLAPAPVSSPGPAPVATAPSG